ncbi:hypothetical protein HORIV_27320 [Vreelandella olivaria]|uniref:Uncharacterized protein n=1 Tax=Vreelandella olivaria TaxID=390919 RepID=A0ABM7GIB4_9GAMM|nr:hypothetical protein HORIV_27320 [Halomonas olivaria]
MTGKQRLNAVTHRIVLLAEVETNAWHSAATHSLRRHPHHLAADRKAFAFTWQCEQ